MGERRVSKALIALLVVGAIAAAALTAVVLLDDGEDGPRRPQLDAAAGLRDARAACQHLARFEAMVDANAPADDVRATIREAEAAGTAASRADPRWVPLFSGTQALRFAIDTDDAAAARVGIDVVRSECSDTELRD